MAAAGEESGLGKGRKGGPAHAHEEPGERPVNVKETSQVHVLTVYPRPSGGRHSRWLARLCVLSPRVACSATETWQGQSLSWLGGDKLWHGRN